MSYIVLTADSYTELERKVSGWIIEGYIPQGGVSVSAYMDENPTNSNYPKIYCETWAQAMIKLPHES